MSAERASPPASETRCSNASSGERDAALGPERSGEPALRVLERPPDDRADLVVGQRLEAPDAHPRQERGVDLEVGVLGRRADERDRAVLDVGQQRVLLGLVEAMDLVEEQDRPRAVQGEPFLGLGDGRADLDDARHDGREATKWAPISPARRRARLVLPVPGGPHSSSEDEVAAGDAAAERSALADEVVLADELRRGPRAHARGERLAFGRWLEEGLGACALVGRRAGGMPAMVARARRPSRRRYWKMPSPVNGTTAQATNSRATANRR